MILEAIDWDPLLWRALVIDTAGLLITAALLIMDRIKGEDE